MCKRRSCCYCIGTCLFVCGFGVQCSPTLTFVGKKMCFRINIQFYELVLPQIYLHAVTVPSYCLQARDRYRNNTLLYILLIQKGTEAPFRWNEGFVCVFSHLKITVQMCSLRGYNQDFILKIDYMTSHLFIKMLKRITCIVFLLLTVLILWLFFGCGRQLVSVMKP